MGDLGVGKTLWITIMAFLSHLAGKTILSNYRLKFPHKRVNNIGDLDSIVDENPDDFYFFAFDEPFMTIDSRQSHSNLNIELAKRILQSRKMNLDIYYSARFLREVEVRLRAVTNWINIPNITGIDQDGKPVKLLIKKIRRDMEGNMSDESQFPFTSLLYNPYTDKFVNVCDLYETRERIIKMEGKRKIETLFTKKQIEDYTDFYINHKISKKEMMSKIYDENPDVYKSDIEDFINVLSIKKKIENED